MKRASADWVVALPLLLMSVLLYAQATTMPEGPATFPRAVTLLMGALSLALLLRNLIQERGLTGRYWHSEGPGAMRTVLVVTALTVVYVFTIGKIVYPISTGLYFALMMGVLGLRPRWLVPLVAGGSVLAIWVLFVRLLRVSLE